MQSIGIGDGLLPRPRRNRARSTSQAQCTQIRKMSARGHGCRSIRARRFQIIVSDSCRASSASSAKPVIRQIDRIICSSIGRISAS